MSGGALRYLLAFDRRRGVDDGAGAVESEFVEQFQIQAELQPRFAGEAVQQARLQGQSTFTVVVRSCRDTRAVGTDWRARDVRSAADPDAQTVYAITSGPIDVEGKNRYLEFLMQTGKAP
ncbi:MULTISPECIES: head-tail adaptor protein [unclassified Bradyrhizobium]|uniref:head-tail adaptor protein n=1 Tax=unclassified Bradyrhizobium TaxID=2631580 RepID=UPI002916F2F6|nr:MULTISPECIES: head-tail adaptor protein [unclassified Bradyrhizobium]